MKSSLQMFLFTSIVCFSAYSQAQLTSLVKIEGEKIEFNAKTNVLGVEIIGTSQTASGSLEVIEDDNGLQMQNINLIIPVEALKTGMALRDRHMKEQIFTTSDGKVTDIAFESERISCGSLASKATCQAEGFITIRGKKVKATIPIIISREGSKYSANAEFELALKDFEIEPPSHFGVSIENKVTVKTSLAGEISGTKPVIMANSSGKIFSDLPNSTAALSSKDATRMPSSASKSSKFSK